MNHPTAEQLRDFNLGRITNPIQQARIEDHIAECSLCCEALRSAPPDPLLERLRSGSTTTASYGSSAEGAWSEGSGSGLGAIALESTVGNQQGSTLSRTPIPARRASPTVASRKAPPPAWLPVAAMAGAACLLLGALWGVSSLIASPANNAPAGSPPRSLAQTGDGTPAQNGPTIRPSNPGTGAPLVAPPSPNTSAHRPGVHPPGVLIVIPHGKFWYGDYGPVREVLHAAGIKTRLASTALTDATPIPGSGGDGQRVRPEILLSQVQPLDYDAIVFAGGEVADFIDGGPAVADVRRVSKEMLDGGRLVTSLCAGNSILAANGLLRGIKAARGQYVPDYIASRAGAEWMTQDVVDSGQIITGRDFRVAQKFAEHLRDRLLKGAK